MVSAVFEQPKYRTAGAVIRSDTVIRTAATDNIVFDNDFVFAVIIEDGSVFRLGAFYAAECSSVTLCFSMLCHRFAL
jgi:hypothetical protein